MSILVINPGSTSTKLAVYDNGEAIAAAELSHDREVRAQFERVADQFDFRMQAIRSFLDDAGIGTDQLRAVVGRGGLLRPLEGGVYAVSETMVEDLRSGQYGEHPCNLGGLLALDIAEKAGVPAYVVDPVVTDELMDTARLTGLPTIERRSLFHALNQRGVARLVADRLGVDYDTTNFIVCHMGGGISIGAHRHGRVVDVINGLDGEGPFTPERTGGLPVLSVLDQIKSGTSPEELHNAVVRQGGLYAHLGTNDPREVVARIEDGDERARLVFDALAYGIARYIASMAPPLADERGQVNVAAVVLTGGLARSGPLVAEITRLAGWIAPVEVVPGEVEMASLAAGAERALGNQALVRQY